METKAEGKAAGRRAEPRRPEPKKDQVELKHAKEPPGGSARNTQSGRMPDEHRRRIAEEAYYRAERRGFTAGFEDVDWLEAEKEIDSRQDTSPGKGEPNQRAARASEKRSGKPSP